MTAPEERARRSLKRLHAANPSLSADVGMTPDAEMSMVDPATTTAPSANSTSTPSTPNEPSSDAVTAAAAKSSSSTAAIPESFKVGPPKGKKKKETPIVGEDPSKEAATLTGIGQGPAIAPQLQNPQRPVEKPVETSVAGVESGPPERKSPSGEEREEIDAGTTPAAVGAEGSAAKEGGSMSGAEAAESLKGSGAKEGEGEDASMGTTPVVDEEEGRAKTSSPKRPRPRVISNGPREPNTMRALRRLDEGYAAEDEQSSN